MLSLVVKNCFCQSPLILRHGRILGVVFLDAVLVAWGALECLTDLFSVVELYFLCC